MTDQDLRRIAAYHEAGHAVMIYLLGSQIRYRCIDRDGGVTDHIEQLGYERYILDKVAGVVGAEAGFKDRSDEFNRVLRSGGQKDFLQCKQSLDWVYAVKDGKPLGNAPDAERSQRWYEERYLRYEAFAREALEEPARKAAISELAEALLSLAPTPQDASAKVCMSTDDVHRIVSKHVQFNSLTVPQDL